VLMGRLYDAMRGCRRGVQVADAFTVVSKWREARTRRGNAVPNCDRDEDGDVDDDGIVAGGCDLRAVCLVRAMTTDVCGWRCCCWVSCCSRWRMWMLSGWRELRRRR
jgi:hypothetical protein